ncbi:MAG: AtpZ/AtpI family protein [Planctomycetes bacterium]|nr:AtpZ/AtpI family protein [Planctomycetota bacterium]
MPAPSWTRGSDALGAALTLAVAVALFAFGGHRLDLALESSPVFVLVGLALGGVGGFIHVLRVLAPDLLPFGKSRQPRDSAAEQAATEQATAESSAAKPSADGPSSRGDADAGSPPRT